jgi:hypothetical protein
VRDVLTEHEALPSEVFVQFRVADHFVELDGVWQFGNVESRQVGHPMVPGISRPQRRSIKVTRRNETCGLACDVVLIDKVEDIVYGCSSCRLRLGRFHRLWNVTRAWVASWRPMGWACVNALNHVGQFNLRIWSVFALKMGCRSGKTSLSLYMYVASLCSVVRIKLYRGILAQCCWRDRRHDQWPPTALLSRRRLDSSCRPRPTVLML